jgi:hypothetical protein
MSYLRQLIQHTSLTKHDSFWGIRPLWRTFGCDSHILSGSDCVSLLSHINLSMYKRATKLTLNYWGRSIQKKQYTIRISSFHKNLSTIILVVYLRINIHLILHWPIAAHVATQVQITFSVVMAINCLSVFLITIYRFLVPLVYTA